jgi:hypothetical protein
VLYYLPKKSHQGSDRVSKANSNTRLILILATVAVVVVLLGVYLVQYKAIPVASPDQASASLVVSGSSTPSLVVSASPAAVVHLPGDPDAKLTPGATNPTVTQANIKTTICASGFTATIRPTSSYTTALKKTQIVQYGYSDTKTASYEEDHLISLELGGAPKDANNLWPEPYVITYQGALTQNKVIDVGARSKDKYENYLNAEVCDGKMTLLVAQQQIATDWVGGWLTAGMPSGAGSVSDN